MKPCTKEENEELIFQINAGNEEVRERFITGNMAYVAVAVKSFVKKHPQFSHLQDDLISEGYFVLVNIIEKAERLYRPQAYMSVSLRNAFTKLVQKEKHHIGLDGEGYIQIPVKKRNGKILSVRTRQVYHKPNVAAQVKKSLLDVCVDRLDQHIVPLQFKGHTDTEIAELCGSTRQTVNRRWNNITKRAKKDLST